MEHETTIQIDGDKVRSLREQQNLTQLYIATVVAVTTDTISRWENKRYPSIKRENALKLAEALEVPLEALLETVQDTQEIVSEEAPPVKEQPPVEEQSQAPTRFQFGRQFLAPRYLLLLPVLLLLGVAGWLLLPEKESRNVHAYRYLPSHVLPGQVFPVLIKVDTMGDFSSSFLLRESFSRFCGVRQTLPPVLARDVDGHQIKWIRSKAENGPTTFSYLLLLAKDAPLNSSLDFSGTIVMGRRGSGEPEVSGSQSTQVGPFHWADENRDNRIDDYEMLSVYEIFPNHVELGIDIAEIETIWASSGYRWNSALGRIDLMHSKEGESPSEQTTSLRKRKQP
jgi:transcriptional regulator with XRE-family HTH domain